MNTINYFEEFQELLELEIWKNSIRKLGVSENTILLVMDFEEKYRREFMKRVVEGQPTELALSVCMNLIYIEKLAERDYEIEWLRGKIELLHGDVDILESRIEELMETQVVNNITNVYNVVNENKPSWACNSTGDVVWDSYIANTCR